MNKALLISIALLLTACAQDFVLTSQNKLKEQFPGIAKQEYVAGTEDMPVYYGFMAQEEKAVSYDTTDGRILDAEFYSKVVSADDVRKFYNTTLPELGWSMREYQIYERDGEILKLSVLEKGGKTILKFNIRPSVS
jgi:hypothetical protein